MSPIPSPLSWRRHVRAAGLIGTFLVLAVASMQRMTVTADEHRHFEYGWQLLNGAPEVDETRMPVVALNALPRALASVAAPVWIQRRVETVETGRYVTVLAAALFGLVVFRWARELYGPVAGLLALTLYTFDPNILAHARLVTNDVYAAGMILLVLYLFWRYLNEGGWRWALATAVGLGVSQLAKYTSLFLFPILALIALGRAAPDLWRLIRRGTGRALGRRAIAFGSTALVFLFVSWLVVNAAFLFRYARIPLREYGFHSELMHGPEDPDRIPTPSSPASCPLRPGLRLPDLV